MRKLTSVPEGVIAYRRIAEDAALRKVLHGQQLYCQLPVRIVRMRIVVNQCGETIEQIRPVIVPATSIFVAGKPTERVLFRDMLRFFVTGTSEPFPIAHIFSSNGGVCLGDIFVPSILDNHSPQQVIDTLFLHNDIVLSHGGASIILDNAKAGRVRDFLAAYDIKPSEAFRSALSTRTNLLEHDLIWGLSADVLDHSDNPIKAIKLMSELYDIMFEPSNT